MFFYDDSTKSKFGGSIAELDPIQMFLKHLSNYFYLKFIATNPNSSFADKNQATFEMNIAERKMDFWKKHPRYSVDALIPELNKLKKDWNGMVDIDLNILQKHERPKTRKKYL